MYYAQVVWDKIYKQHMDFFVFTHIKSFKKASAYIIYNLPLTVLWQQRISVLNRFHELKIKEFSHSQKSKPVIFELM